ncbi:protein SUPPRESSOR OF GENE SILENCING 3 [Sesamum indicum]|uniref:Protein SUPPRESSOR OF GENE SILENCING 3 n=1 Tax=Sesamum indicum TaxID=4182 RepID=A0A6I9UH81_SESIN|nr:protein SUPPRESSOR OF GENE SILENCING 3 [Sesamum indicum]
MSSRKGIVYPSNGGTSDPSFKGKSTSDVSNPGIDQLSHGVSDMNVNSAQDDGWEVYGKKSRNRTGSNSSKQWGPQHSSSKAWGHSDTVQRLGMRNHGGLGRGSGQTWPTLSSDSRKHAGRGYTKPPSSDRSLDPDYAAAPPVIPPPLKNGWGWSTRVSSTQSSGDSIGHSQNAQRVHPADDASKGDDVDEESDVDDTDDELMNDDFDSDESQKSHETRKKNRWFKELFQCLDGLTVEQINEPERQWHCPACKGGPGAIDWYRGLQPLIAHARTKRSKRVKLHRELAELLDEELRRRGTSAVPAGEIFGKWKGLEKRADKEIVWPPMVVIMNTKHEKDENDKWIGMGNQELLDYFNAYSAVKARHSYGPQGHRGMSVLIFEASAVGYAEAERLSKHFEDTCRDRLAWERNRVLFYPGGKRQLYGYMAEKQDMDNFNQHSQGKSKLKYEMRSYQEMVVNQMKQMSEDNQQLIWFKNKVAEEQTSKKALEESYGIVTEKLRKTMEENRIVKLRTKKHHEQNKEEMDYQEEFFRDRIQQLYDARNAKEEKFEKVQQYEREKVTIQSEVNVSSAEERLRRAEEAARFIQLQDKEMEEFVNKRDKLMKAHEDRMLDLKRRHWDEKMALEKEFDEEFNKLMEEYTPGGSKQDYNKN